MEAFQSIILGIIQGLTEFLPISSSGHLLLIRQFLGWKDPGEAFDAALHIGTLLASIAVFWSPISDLIQKFLGKPLKSDVLRIIVVSIPVAIIGYFMQDKVDALRFPVLAALMLIGLGLLFLFVPGTDTELPAKRFSMPNWLKSLTISLSQVLAFIPGSSRSGISILTGRLLGLSFTQALQTSFILGIPIISAAGAWGFVSQISEVGLSGSEAVSFTLGIVTSFISGFLAGSFLKNKLSKIGLRPFGVYRILLGLLILVIFLAI